MLCECAPREDERDMPVERRCDVRNIPLNDPTRIGTRLSTNPQQIKALLRHFSNGCVGIEGTRRFGNLN